MRETLRIKDSGLVFIAFFPCIMDFSSDAKTVGALRVLSNVTGIDKELF